MLSCVGFEIQEEEEEGRHDMMEKNNQCAHNY